MKKIAVVTGTRAEYGILKPIIEKIKKSKELTLQLIVTGMHLSESRGYTINEIKKDDFKIDKVIPMYPHGKDISFYGIGVGLGIMEMTTAFSELKSDIILILGDRLEPFAAAVSATSLNLPIAHIGGGDTTISGHIDEQIRHALTKLSHIHFTATEKGRNRIKKMGEEAWRIFVVGAPSLDIILNNNLLSKKEICEKLSLSLKNPIILCVQHPVIHEAKEAGRQMKETLEAIKELKKQTVVIYPNSDYGGDLMIKEIEEYRKQFPYLKVFKNLSHGEYLSLLKNVDVMIGNSSSGIVEAPSFHIPVVNIGIRNKGREHAENIIDVPHKKEEIVDAIERALMDERFKEKVKGCKNPYGNGKASEKILTILEKIEINKELLAKQMTY